MRGSRRVLREPGGETPPGHSPGHRNPSTTLNVYAHFVPESDQEAADAIGKIFGEAARGIDAEDKKNG